MAGADAQKRIDWRIVTGYAAGALVALGVFVLARWVVDKAVALLVLGLTPFAALALPDRLRLNVERRGHAFACGLSCLALSLTAGVAGPILDVFFVRSQLDRHTVVATKALTQCLSHALKVTYFAGVMATGDAGVTPWFASVMLLLAVAGTSASRRVLSRISDASFRRWTRWTVMATGAAYLLGGLRLWMA